MNFTGFQIGLLGFSAGAELKYSSNKTILPSVNLCNQSAAVELRHYQNYNKDYNAFFSARLSSRERFGVGIGLSNKEAPLFLSPVFGAYYDMKTDTFAPFITFTIGVV